MKPLDQNRLGDRQEAARAKRPAHAAAIGLSPAASRFLPPIFWDWALGLSALALYSLTLSPGVLPADAGEYQLTGALLGVAHPPGFAWYTLLSWLTARLLFFLPPAAAINWLSAVLAALALALTSRAVRYLTGSTAAGLCAALALGFSTTFWAQATTANIRMPTALALAFGLERILAYRQRLADQKAASPGWAAFALGLGVAHHGSLIFITAVLGLHLLWLNPSILRRPLPLLWGLLPFLTWAYFPLRAGAYGAPPGLASVDGFLEHVLALGFRGDILFFANPADLPGRLLVLGNILTFQFSSALLALATVGAGLAVWRERALGVTLLAALAAHTFIAITYRAPQTVEYLLPSYVLMALPMGFAFAQLLRLPSGLAASRPMPYAPAVRRLPASPFSAALRKPALALVAAAFLVTQFLATYPSYRALAEDTSTRHYAEAVLAGAPPGAVVLAAWHWATPLWYLQEVEGRRPDVEVRYVFPRGDSLARNWVDEIEAALPQRPVVVTSFYEQEFRALTYRFLPLGPAWEVRAEPLQQPPAGLSGAQSFGAWDFLGYSLQTPASPAAGGVALTAAWRTLGPPADINFFVHLVGPDGQLYGQMDVSHPSGRYVSGEVLLDRYHIVPRPGAPSGEYGLVAGAYRPDGTRLAEAPLTTVDIQLPPGPRPPAGAVPLGDSIYLTRSSLSPRGSLRPGERLAVDLYFLAVRPITSDYVVKVDLIGPDWQWRVQSDSIPASGAIPTLKWIAGSRILDRHVLTIPMDAAPGPAHLALAVYDFFTQQPLPILDADLAALGPTVPLGTVDIAAP